MGRHRSASPAPRGCALVELPARCDRVREARRFTAAVLTRWRLPEETRERAVLAVGELTANAAQYGRSEMTVLLSLGTGELRLVVADHGDPRVPRQPRACGPEERGRGLGIVDCLATRVEISDTVEGRTVRAGLPAAPAPADTAAAAPPAAAQPAEHVLPGEPAAPADPAQLAQAALAPGDPTVAA
ncbi:ATP-binding protein [Streptomyces physcomitrii]|uniref:ATP-binding protein n=1 Tax=Streptomyces physcomitrii TaxID=2724184 RepID=UPI003400BA6F